MKKHSIRLALFASPIGLVNRMILSSQYPSCDSVTLLLSRWNAKKQRINNNQEEKNTMRARISGISQRNAGWQTKYTYKYIFDHTILQIIYF